MEKTRRNPYRTLPKGGPFIGRETIREDLIENLPTLANTVVMGVEGVGKSTLFESVFTPEYCAQMARDEHILINRLVYPTSLENGGAVFEFFFDAAKNAAEWLKDCGEEALYEDILDKVKASRETNGRAESTLQDICKHIKKKGYNVVLVIDQFELLTSSGKVSQDQFGVLRSVLAQQTLYFIVATDYDFDKDCLPENTIGSVLAQLFADAEMNQLFLKGFNEEECGEFLRNISGRDDFTENELHRLFILTGGIPPVLFRAAYYAWEQKNAGANINWQGVKEALLENQKSRMDGWLKILTPQEAALLCELANQADAPRSISNGLRDGIPSKLLKRGLIVALGNNCYGFNSALLQAYCTQHSPEPHRPESLHSGMPTPATPPTSTPAPPQINIYGPVVAGDALFQTNNQVLAPSVSEILRMLASDTSQSLADQLAKCSLRVSELLPADLSLPEAVREQRYDEAFSEAACNILPDLEVDEDQNLINVPPTEQETLDDRFRQAQANARRNLPDALLDQLSPRCKFYLKLAVVVEDALSPLGAGIMSDYSPYLLFYGKALEQALRDNLFPLFHEEEELSSYDTYADPPCKNENSNNCFRRKSAKKCMIGNFEYLIRYQAGYLGELCDQQGIEALDGTLLSREEWIAWWNDLHNQVDSARKIRNLADHSSDRDPGVGKLDDMCEALLGTEERPGILARLKVGNDLYLKLFPSPAGETPQLAASRS